MQPVLPGGGLSDPITVKLWDAATGVERQSLTGSGSRAVQVVFSRDARHVAAGDTVWDAATGREALKVRSASAILAFGRNDQMLACVGRPAGTVRIVVSRSGHLLNAFSRAADEPDDAISLNYADSLSVHPDNFSLLAGPGPNRTVKMWNVATGQEAGTFRGHRGYLTTVKFRPDGKQLAAAGSDGTVRVWELGQDRPTLGLPIPVGFADGRTALFRSSQEGGMQPSELAVSEFPGGRPLYTIRPVDTEMKGPGPAGDWPRSAAALLQGPDRRPRTLPAEFGGTVTTPRVGRPALLRPTADAGVYDATTGRSLSEATHAGGG